MPEPDPLSPAVQELLKLCEQLYFERCTLEAVLKDSGIDWEQKYKQALQNLLLRAQVHGIFERAAVRLGDSVRYEASLQSLLAELAATRKPN